MDQDEKQWGDNKSQYSNPKLEIADKLKYIEKNQKMEKEFVLTKTMLYKLIKSLINK